MTHYFLRTSHRERINSIKLGKVCPGGIDCSTTVHYSLLAFEILAPYVIGHMIMPLTVKARVRYAYQHLVKKDDDSELKKEEKPADKKKVGIEKDIVAVISKEEKEKPEMEFIGTM
jgi:hypothetical protein